MFLTRAYFSIAESGRDDERAENANQRSTCSLRFRSRNPNQPRLPVWRSPTSSLAYATSHSRSVGRNRDTQRRASACRPRGFPIRCDWNRAGWMTPPKTVSRGCYGGNVRRATAALSPTSECTFFREALRTAAYTAARNSEILPRHERRQEEEYLRSSLGNQF